MRARKVNKSLIKKNLPLTASIRQARGHVVSVNQGHQLRVLKIEHMRFATHDAVSTTYMTSFLLVDFLHTSSHGFSPLASMILYLTSVPPSALLIGS